MSRYEIGIPQRTQCWFGLITSTAPFSRQQKKFIHWWIQGSVTFQDGRKGSTKPEDQLLMGDFTSGTFDSCGSRTGSFTSPRVPLINGSTNVFVIAQWMHTDSGWKQTQASSSGVLSRRRTLHISEPQGIIYHNITMVWNLLLSPKLANIGEVLDSHETDVDRKQEHEDFW